MIEVSPKHPFWAYQPLLQEYNDLDLSFNFLRTKIKRSHSVPSQDYTAYDSSNRCFECSKMQLFEPMSESSHCRGEEWSVFGDWFSWFLERQLTNKWLRTTQNWLFCIVLVIRLRNVQFSKKKQAIICLKVLRTRATSVGFGTFWNTHIVDCCLYSGSHS